MSNRQRAIPVTIRVIPEPETHIYECFECGRRYHTNRALGSCIECGEEDNFWLMD